MTSPTIAYLYSFPWWSTSLTALIWMYKYSALASLADALNIISTSSSFAMRTKVHTFPFWWRYCIIGICPSPSKFEKSHFFLFESIVNMFWIFSGRPSLGNLYYKLDFHYLQKILLRNGIWLVMYNQTSLHEHSRHSKTPSYLTKLVNTCKVCNENDNPTEFDTLLWAKVNLLPKATSQQLYNDMHT